MKLWDDMGKLRLISVQDKEASADSRLFPVFKNQSSDRIVMDRQIQNTKEMSFGGMACMVGGGPDLVEFRCPKGWKVRMISEDLQDYFPSIDASAEKADSKQYRKSLPCVIKFVRTTVVLDGSPVQLISVTVRYRKSILARSLSTALVAS